MFTCVISTTHLEIHPAIPPVASPCYIRVIRLSDLLVCLFDSRLCDLICYDRVDRTKPILDHTL